MVNLVICSTRNLTTAIRRIHSLSQIVPGGLPFSFSKISCLHDKSEKPWRMDALLIIKEGCLSHSPLEIVRVSVMFLW